MRQLTLPALLLLLTSAMSMGDTETARGSTRQRVGSYSYGQCHVQGNYVQNMDSFNSLETRREYQLGDRWKERCRNCSCQTFGAWCRGPTCDIQYDFTQEKWCLEWSEDGCCCERLGCLVDGKEYALGEEFPYGEGNPCLTCTCEIGTSLDYCLRQKCGTYNVVCEDSTVTYDDKCCPHYTCPVGVFCEEFPDPFPATPHNELLEWYRGSVDPLPVGMTQYFHVDSWNTYVCTCPRGGTASCHMESSSFK